MATKTIKRKATKAATKKSVAATTKIKTAAIQIQDEIVSASKNVIVDAVEVGKKWTNVAIDSASEQIEKVDISDGVDSIKENVQNLNKIAISTANTMVDNALENGMEVQKLANKAITGSIKIAAKQQTILFDTLDVLKKQLAKNGLRFISILNKN